MFGLQSIILTTSVWKLILRGVRRRGLPAAVALQYTAHLNRLHVSLRIQELRKIKI